MTIRRTELEDGVLIEAFADEGKVFDLGDGIYETYVCLPPSFRVEELSEIPLEELPVDMIAV